MALLWLLTLPLLVLFYLFRPEPRKRASTTYFLWKQSSPESQGGKFARRLRSNPLMWLQLLMLALLALYLARPATVWRSLLPPTSRIVLVVDRSASMSAQGVFPRAQEQALEALDGLFGFQGLGRGTEVMLVAVDREPQILVPFTNDETSLRQALEGLEVSHAPDNLAGLRPFLSSLVTDQKATIWLFSDHLPEELEISGLQFSSAANEQVDNVGIVTFSVETPQSASLTTRPFLYARVQNNSSAAQQRLVVLEKMRPNDSDQVEAVISERSVLLAAGAGQTIDEPIPASRLSAQEPSLFRLRLKPVPGKELDPFPLDDTAYTVAPPFTEHRVSVSVAGGLKAGFLLRALLASSNVEVLEWKGLLQHPDPPPLDLLVSPPDFPVPDRLKVRSRFLLTQARPGEDTPVATLQAGNQKEAELVQNVGTEWHRLKVQVTDQQSLESGEKTLLLTSDGTPALTLSGLAQGQPSLHWRFPLSYSSLPLSPALPVVVGRFVDRYSRGTTLPYHGSLSTSQRRTRPPGVAWKGELTLHLDGTQVARVGEAETSLPRLSKVGFYQLQSGDKSAPLAVNLFSLDESALPITAEDRSFTDESAQTVTTTTQETLQYREAGTPLLAILLLFLFLEAAVFLWRGRP